MAPSDEELVRGLIAGNEQAFTELYRRHHPAVYRFALLMSGSETTADDVTQAVFMVLMEDARRYDGARASLSAYLVGIARNHVLRRLKQDRNFVPLVEDDSIAANNQLENLEREERIKTIRKAVFALPVHYREVVVLCDFEEMKYSDAARMLGCSVGTVCSRLHRGHLLLCNRIRKGPL